MLDDDLPFDALEADFQRFYGLDLRIELWGPKPMGVRRFFALVKWLPQESAIRRATGSDWSTEKEFMATTLELLDVGNRMYYEANKREGAKSPKPIEVPRPSDKPKVPRHRADAFDIALAFGVDAIKKDEVNNKQ